jgi:hypothetical protein
MCEPLPSPAKDEAEGEEIVKREKDWCCTLDDNEGFDFCGVVCCGQQCGTGACCLEDKDGHMFACVLYEFQCDCLFLPALLWALFSGRLFCPGYTTFKALGIPHAPKDLAATHLLALRSGFKALSPATEEGLRMLDCLHGASLRTRQGLETAATAAGLLLCPCLVMPCYFADNAALVDGVTLATSWNVDCASFACFSRTRLSP